MSRRLLSSRLRERDVTSGRVAAQRRRQLSKALAELQEAAGSPRLSEVLRAAGGGLLTNWDGLGADRRSLSKVLDALEAAVAKRQGPERAAELREVCVVAYVGAKDPWVQPAAGIPDYLDTVVEAVRSIVPALKWLGAALLSGVLGNAAFDALKQAVGRRKGQAPVTAEDALALAESAVRVRCHEMGLSQPARLDHYKYQAADGRWIVGLCDRQTLRRFYVRIPPGRPNDEQLSLDIFVPDAPALDENREQATQETPPGAEGPSTDA